jgi:capsular exopolysaccharide synthesis family protein
MSTTLKSARPGPSGAGALTFEETGTLIPKDLQPATTAAITPGNPVAEEFRILSTKVRTIGDQRPFACVGVVSASAGEGKTTVTLGLASAMSQEPGRRVLLIEADLRKPSISRYLGQPAADGLAEWVESGRSVVPVRRVSPQGFHIITAGRSSGERRHELLQSERMARLLTAARSTYDWVLLDCPPLTPVADAVVIQDLLDGFLLVVRARHAPVDMITRALSHVKADLIQGMILNDHEEVLRKYSRYGYKAYGEYK